MPGLTDAHAHITLTEVDVSRLEKMPLTLLTAHAARSAKAMLDRGYTTIRDAGGADWGLARAIVEEAEAWNTYVLAHAYSARAMTASRPARSPTCWSSTATRCPTFCSCRNRASTCR